MTSHREIVSIFGSRAEQFDEQAFEGGDGLRYISSRELRAVTESLGPAPGRVLDVGAGTGRIARTLTDLGATVTAVDAVPQMIDRCRHRAPRAALVIADAGTALPFRADCFDAVSCIRVLKYVAEWPRALAELRRSLRDGGRLIVEVTNKRSLARWGYRSLPVRACTMGELRRMFERGGFTVDSTYAGVRLPFVLYRWARSGTRLRWLLRAERLIGLIVGPTAFARSFIVTCSKKPRPSAVRTMLC
jgi:ubiquinone/menaquinone biosynthesis C-methylase UbiE